MINMPLRRFATAVRVLYIIVNTSSNIFVRVDWLRFGPKEVGTLFIRGNTRNIAGAVANYPTVMASAFRRRVSTNFTRQLISVAAPKGGRPMLSKRNSRLRRGIDNLL